MDDGWTGIFGAGVVVGLGLEGEEVVLGALVEMAAAGLAFVDKGAGGAKVG